MSTWCPCESWTSTFVYLKCKKNESRLFNWNAKKKKKNLLSFQTLCGSHVGWSSVSVLLFWLFAYTWKIKNTGFYLIVERDITWTNVSFWWQLILYFTEILFPFNNFQKKTGFVLYGQHFVDLPFHATCYQGDLQLAEFAARVAWMDGVTFAMLHCILCCKALIVH